MRRLLILPLFIAVLFASCRSVPETPAPRQTPSEKVKPELEPEAVPEPEKKEEPATAAAAAEPHTRPDAYARLFSNLTPEAEIGQLFMVEVRDPANGHFLTGMTESYRKWAAGIQPGGFILFAENLVSPEQTRSLIRDLNSITTVPPFIALDEEGGIVSRLNAVPAMNATPLPPNSRIGATGDPLEATKAARIIAGELLDLGFSVDFAPVADVHVPGTGDAIGPRSYGTDPALVARMVAAFSSTLQEEGILSVAKHFPGHGAAAGDSHNGKTLLNAPLQTLEQREFVPFREAIRSGIGGIMIGHITVPALDSREEPATLSRKVATDLLRDRFGYGGLIFTDSLRMRGVTGYYDADLLPLLTFEAGADMLLMPVSPRRARDKLLEAYTGGRVSEQRLNASLQRIEAAKRRFLPPPVSQEDRKDGDIPVAISGDRY